MRVKLFIFLHMRKLTVSRFVVLSLMGILFYSIISCKKQTSSIGLDIQPEEDLLNATYLDTTAIISYTIEEDSLRTDRNATGSFINLIGSYYDPVFGRSDASIYTALMMPNNITGSGFGPNAKLDSVVLAIVYRGKENTDYYGDIEDQLKFNVYRLNETLSTDSIYYSNRQLKYFPDDITYTGQGVFVNPDLTTKFSAFDKQYLPQLRIRLKDEVGQYFMDDTTRMKSTPDLQKFFNGLYITTESSQPAKDRGYLLKMNMLNEGTKLTIYYHNGSSNKLKGLDMTLGSAAQRYNYYKHDYTKGIDSLYKQLPGKTDTVLGQKCIFLQGMAGVKAKLYFPNLLKLAAKGPVAINKAELILKVNRNPYFVNESKYHTPPQLMLEIIDNKKQTYTLLENVNDPAGFGGSFNASTYEYRFQLPFTTQQLVSGKYNQNYRFNLRLFGHQLNPARIVLGGAKNGQADMKLKVWYTKLYK